MKPLPKPKVEKIEKESVVKADTNSTGNSTSEISTNATSSKNASTDAPVVDANDTDKIKAEMK